MLEEGTARRGQVRDMGREVSAVSVARLDHLAEDVEGAEVEGVRNGEDGNV